ncbi:MAG: hypothetical protein F6K03_11795 [Kamptonema sp. SIO4C4]|nr:hypothetical protein [Kamptonema sp. SIO4C4]
MKKKNLWTKSLSVLTVATLSLGGTANLAQAASSSSAPHLDSFSAEAEVSQIDTTKIAAICPSNLPATITNIIKQPTFSGARWGVHIESLEQDRVLYTYNTNLPLIPASNNKLFTTAAALQLYDPQSPVASSTLGAWVGVINTRSHNNYADRLFRGIGGYQATQQALSRLGIAPNSFRQVDGSGLSRQNVATPFSLVEILKVMKYAYGSNIFYASLPVAGRSGTLRNRFRSTPVEGRVRAKTGTLRGVRALSGYMEHPQYGEIIFSILVNQPGQSGQRLINAIDQIVLSIAKMNAARCTSEVF